MSIFVDGIEKKYKENMQVRDLINVDSKDIFTCKINSKLKDLSYKICDGDNISLLGFSDEDSIRVYEASLRYLVAMACKKVFPNLRVVCDYYISRSICFKKKDGEFSENEFLMIKDKVKEQNPKYTLVIKIDRPYVE